MGWEGEGLTIGDHRPERRRKEAMLKNCLFEHIVSTSQSKCRICPDRKEIVMGIELIQRPVQIQAVSEDCQPCAADRLGKAGSQKRINLNYTERKHIHS